MEATRICRLGLQAEPTGKPVAGMNQTKDENDQFDRFHKPTIAILPENKTSGLQVDFALSDENAFRFQIVTFLPDALYLRLGIQ
jgi:hypothetical protein